MTDRYNSLVVTLEKPMRSDDAEFLINAIRMLKGVLKVKPGTDTSADYHAEQRVRHELGVKLWEVLYPKDK